MKLVREGSVRVDLLGGTLDLEPINVALPKVITLNLATGLKARVTLEKSLTKKIDIYSHDYKQSLEVDLQDDFVDSSGRFTFILKILNFFQLSEGLKVELTSGSPPGAGLGGSSAMGITLYLALCDYLKEGPQKRSLAVTVVRNIEAQILQGPAGYQDYYPALYGGVLGLKASVAGLQVEQLYSSELKKFLEQHITLVYSGTSRISGINNWEVYKSFFDGDTPVGLGLKKIAELSFQAYEYIRLREWNSFLKLIGEEGKIRATLFKNIVTPSMQNIFDNLQKEIPSLGMKVCGAGGGGCFLLTHPPDMLQKVAQYIETQGMKRLPLQVAEPL